MEKVLAFDIGGTNTRLALINEDYEIEKLIVRKTIRFDKEAFKEALFEIIGEFDLTNVKAIGMGVPGYLNHDRSGIVWLSNAGIRNLEIRNLIKERYGLDVYMRNDCEVAVLGEEELGAGKGYDKVFFVTISTGLGGAMSIKGKVQDYIIEIGHSSYFYKGIMSEYERLASGSGIVRLAKMNGLDIVDAKEFFELVEKDDPKAKEVYLDWLKILSEFLKMIKKQFDPDIICLTGGVMKAKNIFFSDLKGLVPDANIVECTLKESAGLIGAALYAFEKIKKA